MCWTTLYVPEPGLADLESVLGATPHEFESRILRRVSSTNAGNPLPQFPAFCLLVPTPPVSVGIRIRPWARRHTSCDRNLPDLGLVVVILVR